VLERQVTPADVPPKVNRIRPESVGASSDTAHLFAILLSKAFAAKLSRTGACMGCVLRLE